MLTQDATRVLTRLALAELREGMVLEEALVSPQGMLLLAKVYELTGVGIQRIRMIGEEFGLEDSILVSAPTR